MAKPQIAILGGGAGAVTAALELSKPGWEAHYESISLYQQGWRLGGKGACGRGATCASRSTACTSGSASTRTRSGSSIAATRELDGRAEQRTAPLGPGVQ